MHISKIGLPVLLLVLQISAVAQTTAPVPPAVKTFCNPLNLPYNFQPAKTTYREAADPVIVLYKNKYWLFASKQTGYWYSDDLLNWHFVVPEGLPLSIYAPSITVVNHKLCYTTGDTSGTFTTNDPLAGKWININAYPAGTHDPAVFQDSDGKVYLYDGCSNQTPLRYTELDKNSFLPVGSPTPVIYADTAHHGWEVAGEHNRGRKEDDMSQQSITPWIEGSFVNKINNRYYLQYAGPGTEFKTYGDGVYTAEKPTGPFVYQPYSPFSFKPTGFIGGAGHSCTFLDKSHQFWHIATGTISVRHMFERRLMLFPSAVLADGQLVTDTYLGDYPQFAPANNRNHLAGNSPRWMLLSYKKPATASSAKDGFDIKNAFDENIRTWWSAATGNPREWLQVDLEKRCRVNAIQTNFADEGCVIEGAQGTHVYKYIIEASADGKKWTTIVNHSAQAKDAPHDYVQLNKPVMARYLRISNIQYPGKGLFSIYDFRVFGSALGKLPAAVEQVVVSRNKDDQRRANVSWAATAGADFYIVRYGIAPNKLYSNYQVYDANSIDINSLNTGVDYYFTVDAVNATGITRGKIVAR